MLIAQQGKCFFAGLMDYNKIVRPILTYDSPALNHANIC